MRGVTPGSRVASVRAWAARSLVVAALASLCVAVAMAAGTDTARNATFECYYADTANDLSDVGFANALNAFSPSSENDGSNGSVRPTGREQRGETWADLLDGLEPDRPGVAQQGWGPSL